MAIASLALGGASLAIFPLFGLPAVVLAIVALARGFEPGTSWKPLAITGLVLGTLGTVLAAYLVWLVSRVLPDG